MCWMSACISAVYPLLTALSVDEAEAVLHRLPLAIQEYLNGLYPMSYQKNLHTLLIVVLSISRPLVHSSRFAPCYLHRHIYAQEGVFFVPVL
ncbi:MAG: hypothetical protein ACXWPP_09500 [Ktedonobacteraceae bacterium]